MTPSQWLPSKPSEFCGKSGRIAALLFKKAEALQANGGTAKWMLTGPAGTGKSRLALCLGQKLAHHSSAVEQLNGQSLSVDLVREWERSSVYKPIVGERWVKIVDELDCSSQAAQNQLRTYLDKLKGNTVVIATTNKTPKELPEPLQTRFAVFPFEPVGPDEFADFMERNFGFDYMDAYKIGQRNLGCVRAALIDCEQVMDAKEMG
jgi:DNA polymerase III delta prime subunit